MAEHPDIYKQMIAAYVIGTPVTAKYLSENKHLKFAEGPDDTGVLISYNTQSPNVPDGGNLVMGENIGIVINPLNWKRDATLATASENLGSLLPDANYDFDKVPAFADARINLAKGVLVCSSADENALEMYFPDEPWGLGVYHMCIFRSIVYHPFRSKVYHPFRSKVYHFLTIFNN